MADERRLNEKYSAGVAHLEAGRLAPAETLLRAVAKARPSDPSAQHRFGLVLQARGKLKAAAHAFRSASAIAPDRAEPHGALASVLERLGDGVGAEAHARRAAALAQRSPSAHVVLASILRGLGKLDEARQALETALCIDPGDAEALWGRTFLDLLEGDYRTGLAGYERRGTRFDDPALRPLWRGEDVEGKVLLLYGEQGMGDSIQFLRYASTLARRGACVLAGVPIPLISLAGRAPGVNDVLQPALTLPRFDFCCPLPSLPFLLGTTLETIPAAGGYLSAPPERVQHWRSRLGDSERLTVAIAWAGNPNHPNDRNRSARFEDLAPLFRAPNVRWLGLQTGPAAATAGRERKAIRDVAGDIVDFADSAAICECADLVISVDTALCHLAGALGRRVWTLLPFAPDWRWGTSGRDTGWYASMRLYRQRRPGDWAGVAMEAARDLTALASRVGQAKAN